jgi:hypothetical protein
MFFHVTTHYDNIGTKTIFAPRIPITTYLDESGKIIEDEVTPRVCFSTSILGCLLATDFSSNIKNNFTDLNKINLDYFRSLYVYSVDNIPNLFIPKSKPINNNYVGVVPDCEITGEVWSLDPIELTMLYSFDWHYNDELTKNHKNIFLKLIKEQYEREY